MIRLCIILAMMPVAVTADPTVGRASWYGEEYRGKLMADGRPFDPDAFTCASWFYPFGTVLEIRHESRVVFVVVTDRGPRHDLVRRGIIVDLSRRAFEALGPLDLGLLPVTVRRQVATIRRLPPKR